MIAGRSARPGWGLAGACVLSTAGIFILDIRLPLGIAAEIPYVAVVALSIGLAGARATWLFAAAGSVLTAAAFHFSPPGAPTLMVVVNRCLALLAIWITAILVVRHKRAVAALVVTHDDLRRESAAGAQAREDLRRGEARLRRLLESTSVLPWEASAETWRFTYVGPQAARLLGYPVERWYEEGFWVSHIHHDDRASAVDFCRTSSEAHRNFEFEYRMVAADGGIVWFHDLVSVLPLEGPPRELRGFMVDITARKQAEAALRDSEAALRSSHEEIRALAGRLLTAQEEERARLARELHDDLTQRMAALAIEAGKLAEQMVQLPGDVRIRLARMQERLAEVSQDLHGLSRRLHPSIIEELGLVDAIESECARFAEREGIPVEFVPRDVPAELPLAVSLCLYRVTQEGLRNIAKHARSGAAHVSLEGSEGTLHLSIEDTGVGFAPATARGAGLGLSSIEERVRLIGGGLSVRSEAGRGTTLEVRAPIHRGTE